MFDKWHAACIKNEMSGKQRMIKAWHKACIVKKQRNEKNPYPSQPSSPRRPSWNLLKKAFIFGKSLAAGPVSHAARINTWRKHHISAKTMMQKMHKPQCKKCMEVQDMRDRISPVEQIIPNRFQACGPEGRFAQKSEAASLF